MSTHVLENDSLRITVSDAGAELASVVDKATGKERLWTADPSVWNRHAPILFPFVGKLMDGKYRIGGKEYEMKTQHGFARDMEFTCASEGDGKIIHCLESSASTKKNYPYDFRLTVCHSICPENPRELCISWTIENTGSDLMYYSIGGHPGFLVPEGTDKKDCFIMFPGKEELTYINASGKGFAMTDKKHVLKVENGLAAYQEDVPDTWIFEDHQVEKVGIAAPDGTPWVMMDCHEFPMLAVWANPNGPFICLEPWFGRTDDEGFAGTLEEKTGIERLGSGEKKEISYTVTF